jgi:hypothetical protein
MLSAPQGVEGLVLASTSSSISQFVDEARRLIGEMPEAIAEAIRNHEAAGVLNRRAPGSRHLPNGRLLAPDCALTGF